MNLLKGLSSINPASALVKGIHQRMEEKKEIKKMIQELKPELRKAYVQSYAKQKMKMASEKAAVDAMPFGERMRIKTEQHNERIRSYNEKMLETSRLFQPVQFEQTKETKTE